MQVQTVVAKLEKKRGYLLYKLLCSSFESNELLVTSGIESKWLWAKLSSSSLVNNESEDGIWYKSQPSTRSLVKFVRTANACSGMYDAVVLTNDKMVNLT